MKQYVKYLVILFALVFAPCVFCQDSGVGIDADEQCEIFDSSGSGVTIETSDVRVHIVTAGNSGNINATCHTKVAPPEQGALHFDFESTGELCGIAVEVEGDDCFTENWYEVISASGNVTLVCHFKENTGFCD